MPDGMANVGVGMLSEVISKKKINLNAEMDKAIASNPVLKNVFNLRNRYLKEKDGAFRLDQKENCRENIFSSWVMPHH